jgi:hypothetical protein
VITLAVALSLVSTWNIYRALSMRVCSNEACQEHKEGWATFSARLWVALIATVSAIVAAGML